LERQWLRRSRQTVLNQPTPSISAAKRVPRLSEPILRCMTCHKEYDASQIVYTCPACGALLEVIIEPPEVSLKEMAKRPMRVWRYREFLPIAKGVPIVSLDEGGTQLYRCDKLAKWAGIRKLYIKYEGANPTGSFKDRGMTLGVTKAMSLGSTAVACASTGNTSASLSAYAARQD